MNTKNNAWEIYQCFIKAGIVDLTGSVLRDAVQRILGTYDLRQIKIIEQCMINEKWITPKDNERLVFRHYTVNPNGKLRSQKESADDWIKERGKIHD
jgi:hypothetical protein